MKDLKARIAEREEREEKAKKDAADSSNTDADQGSNEEEETSYDGYTVAELKEDLDGRGIEYAAGAKKAELIALLEENDAE